MITAVQYMFFDILFLIKLFIMSYLSLSETEI
jgi:hypothetical protein